MKGKSDQSEYREEAVIPRHVQRGLTLIDELYPLFEKTIVENDKRLTFIEKNDKLYRATILLEIFEAEYSFLLTTSKITFTIDYREQKKIDVKEDCNGAYMLFSEALEEISDYLDIIKEIHETEKNLRLTSYQKTGILETLSKKRSLLIKETRYKISDAMKAIETILTLVITDYNDTKRLLQNPDDIFTFDINIDGKKHLEGKKVIDAIVETFLFASTLAFQTTFGTLSGSGIYIEETDAAT